MSVTLAIPTLRRYDLLKQCVLSAFAGTVRPTHVFIIDNGSQLPPHVRAGLEETAALHRATLYIEQPGRNLGVAASWNRFLRESDDWLIIANDDTRFYPGTISGLVEAASNDPYNLFFFPGADGYKNAWSLFLQRTVSLEKIGPYDEGFSPAYFEDNDYSYRLKLAGLEHVLVKGCGYAHVESATIKTFTPAEQQQHWAAFARNRDRYIAKWGGPPGQEAWRVPFNGHADPLTEDSDAVR